MGVIVSEAEKLLGIWDALRFGLLVHRAVADSSGQSVDLSMGFRDRAEIAWEGLLKTAEVERRRDSPRFTLLGDVERRCAILSAYLGQDVASVRESFDRADDLYRRISFGVDGSFSDEFSRVTMSLERTLTIRFRGQLDPTDAPADASQEKLDRIGLGHLPSELAADSVLNRIVTSQLSERHARQVVVRTGRRGDARSEGRLAVARALEALHVGEIDAAVTSAADALRLVTAADYGIFDGAEAHLDAIFVSFLAGVVSPDGAAGLEALDSSVRRIEEVRGGWRLGSSRSDPLWEPLEQILGECLVRACRSADPGAGRTALRMMEAMRRRHLAGMLRTIRFDETSLPKTVGSPVVALSDAVSLSEDQHLRTRSMSSLAGPDGARRTVFRTIDGVLRMFHEHATSVPASEPSTSASLRPVDARMGEGSLSVGDSAARAEMARLVSDFFAEAFLPEVVSLEEILVAIAGRVAIAFVVLDQHTVARCWMDADGNVEAAVVAVGDTAALLEVFDRSGPPDGPLGSPGAGEDVVSADVSEAVSSALLPEKLRRLIAETASTLDLIVVPDGWLSTVSWAALLDTDGRPIVRSADVMLTPALSLLRSGSARLDVVETGTAACVDYAGLRGVTPLDLGHEHDAFRRLGVHYHSRLAGWLEEMSSEHGHQWTYVACHGVDPRRATTSVAGGPLEGLGIELVDGDGARVTCVDLMAVEWPPLVLLAACYSGRLKWDVRSGLAPLSLSVAALTNGARTVIGGADALPDGRTAQLLTEWRSGQSRVEGVLARALQSGHHPVRALAGAQRAWLDHNPRPTSSLLRQPFYWARHVAMTVDLPPLRGDL